MSHDTRAAIHDAIAATLSALLFAAIMAWLAVLPSIGLLWLAGGL